MRSLFLARILVLVAIALSAGCVGVPEGIEPVTGFQVERLVAKAQALGYDTSQLIYVKH